MINHQSIRKAILLSSLLCAISLSLPVVSTAAAPQELILDSRITQSSSFSWLTLHDKQQATTTKRTDYQEQWRGCITGISNTPGGWNAHRASNLAASKHYTEAIEEMTKAIACYDSPQKYDLTPEWLLSRAELLRHVGLDQEALADIKRALTLKRCDDTAKFQCAQALIEYGEYANAESVLKPLAESGASIFRSYHYYLLGIAQQKQGKTNPATESYKEAATLFASAGMLPPAQACFDAITSLSSKTPGYKPLSLADLTPPKSNVAKIEKLITALMTKDNVFDMEQLKELIGATEIKEIHTGYLVQPYKGHLKELRLVTIDKQPTGGLLMKIHLDPVLCSIDRSAFAPYGKEKIEVEQRYRTDLGHSEGFRVPSGTIIFSMLDNGFKPIQYIELYSREAQYPQPNKQQLSNLQANQPQATGQQPNNPQASQAQSSKQQASNPQPSQAQPTAHKNYYRLMERYWGRYEQMPQAEKLIQEWLKEEPESPSAHLHHADFLESQGKYEEALKAIETAQKFQKGDDGMRSEYSGDLLTIKRGSCLLKQGKFKEALAEFKKGFPEKPTPDHLLMRGRAELGLKKYPEAAKDLKAACEQFYDSCRIVKRDEAQILLKSIPESSQTGTSAQTPPPAVATKTTPKEIPGFLEEQKRQALTRMKAVTEKAQNEQQEKERKEKELITNALNKISEAKKQQSTKPDLYILALLEMARQCGQQKKTTEEKQYLDQAIDCYATYTPQSDYDSCTRALIAQLHNLRGQELDTRLDKIISISELSCKSARLRGERDRYILDLYRYRQAEEIGILEKLIKMREQMQSKTGTMADPLYRQLSWAYNRKGDEKQAVWALEKAIEISQTSQARSRYRIDMALLFLRNRKIDLARRECRKAGEEINWQLSPALSGSFATLAKEFLQQQDRATCKEILDKSFNNANAYTLKEIDNLLSDLIKAFERTKEFAVAEALLKKRIEAGMVIKQDDSLCDWQMQLSEFYLITGRPEQSEKIYKQARESALFQGDAVRGIDLRRQETLARAGIKRKEGTGLSQSEEAPAKTITFPHVLYAFSELSLNGNTSTGSYDSRAKRADPTRFWSKDENGDVCSLNKISIRGNTTVFGSIYGKLPKDTPPQIATWTRLGKTKVVPQAMMQPNSMIVKSSTERTKLGDYKGGRMLAGGDYEATSISSISVERKLTTPVRIFITDDSTTERYAVKLGSSSGQPENIQIWYLGYRPMIFEHNSNVSAVIYAPYSCLTMGNNNCTFHGAIVADKITTIGNVTANYDKALKNRVFTPGEPSQPVTILEEPSESESESEAHSKQATEERSKKLQEARDKQKALFKSRLSKYPALLKLDLLEGPIVYQEVKDNNIGSSCGSIIDDREVNIQGSSSIHVTGENDGTITIILDGLRLMDKALSPLKKKDYKRAEEILVAALRANPESEAFSLLAECWFQQNRYDDAMQACRMAIAIDGKNKSALALKEKLNARMKKVGTGAGK